MRTVLLAAFAVLAMGAVTFSGWAAPERVSSPPRVAAATPKLPRLLGYNDQKLVGVDPETLRPIPGAHIPIGSGGCASRTGGTACWSYAPWTVSPDGATLVVARNDASSLLVVDAMRLRTIGKLRVARNVGALAWLRRDRLLAIQEAAGEHQALVVLDPSTGRTVARRGLGGSIEEVERTARELVLLLAPARTIGTARLAVVGSRGALRSVRLERILAGSKLLGTGAQHRADVRGPALAVDPVRRRAFVVDTAVIAEIDLQTLEVEYHSLARSRSRLQRFRDWLEPVAEAKQVNGYHRTARWLDGELLAVSGSDTERGQMQPAGLQFVDTSTWKVRKVDAETTWFTFAEDLLFAHGDRNGLTAFALDSSERFRLFPSQSAWAAQVYAGRVYVGIAGEKHFQVVDLSDGRVVGVRQEPLVYLLQGVASGWWE